jgi:hypothetical protein
MWIKSATKMVLMMVFEPPGLLAGRFFLCNHVYQVASSIDKL